MNVGELWFYINRLNELKSAQDNLFKVYYQKKCLISQEEIAYIKEHNNIKPEEKYSDIEKQLASIGKKIEEIRLKEIK